ncbi:MAG: hypothetical protein ACSHXK_00175 [Oceanococcus sp.]
MTNFRLILLVSTMAGLVSACGSSTDDDPRVSSATAQSDAPLSTADDAVRAAKLLEAIEGITTVASSTTEFSAPSFNKQYTAKALKLAVTDASCPGGGQFDYDDQGRDDYRQFNFSACVQDDGNTISGALVLECQQGDFSNIEGSSCSDIDINLGQGAQPFSFTLANGQRVTLLGLYSASESNLAEINTLDFEIRSSTADNRVQTLLLARDLEVRLEENGTQVFVTGEIGADFVSNTADCSRGSVDIRTRSAILISDSDDVIGGEILLSNDKNEEAIVTFSSDGGVTVTVAGATTSYSAGQFDKLCEFED